MIADDFKAIADRAADIRARPKFLPETCPEHVFYPPDLADSRCVNCGLHYFHLPAVMKSAVGAVAPSSRSP